MEKHAKDPLAALRARLDEVDEEILQLLNRRAGISLEIGKLKQKSGAAVQVPGREAEVTSRLAALNAGPLSAAQIRAVYEAIFAVSRELQLALRPE